MKKKRATPAAVDRHEQLSLNVLKQFRLIFGSVRHHFRQVEEQCGISGSQLWVLREVVEAPGIGISALARKLSIHQSTCSQLVESLVKHGYLIKLRSGEDQRRVGLNLTKAAAKVLASAPGPAEGLLPTALSGMSNQSLLTLSAHLDKLVAALQVQDKRHAHRPLADL
jgi:MarR family transcriptional regulator, organic hydroperoxide resistance regulator